MRAGPPWKDTGYVFTQDNGTPITLTESLGASHASSGRQAYRTSLSRGFATLMQLCGSKRVFHPKVVSERLGHSNISITMDIYSHVMPGMQEAVAQALDARLATGGL